MTAFQGFGFFSTICAALLLPVLPVACSSGPHDDAERLASSASLMKKAGDDDPVDPPLHLDAGRPDSGHDAGRRWPVPVPTDDPRATVDCVAPPPIGWRVRSDEPCAAIPMTGG